jgi:hypothetical protein
VAKGDRAGRNVDTGTGTAEEAVAVYGKNSVDGDTAIAVDSSGRVQTRPLTSTTDTVGVVAPAPSTLLNQASGAQAAGNSGSLSTAGVGAIEVNVNLTAFTGGTAPTVTFLLDVLGADGVWYQVWTSGAQAAAAAVSQSIGQGCQTAAMLTSACRLRWTFGGTVAPATVTFSASIVGR